MGDSSTPTKTYSTGNTLVAVPYPTDKTRRNIHAWRRTVEARMLRHKMGAAIGTADVHIENLSEPQRAAAMQLQGFLLECMDNDSVAAEQLLAEQRLAPGSIHHGARLFRIMCTSFRQETQSEEQQKRDELAALLRLTIHIDSTPDVIQKHANRISDANRSVNPDDRLTVQRLARCFIDISSA